MKKILVIALGGNALIRRGQTGTFEEQVENVRHIAPSIARLTSEYRIVLTHGNGPQVGNLYLQQECAREIPAMPLHACVAMTQSLIGYMIQTAFSLCCPGIRVNVIPTRVLVDPDDPAFSNPSKPIGPYYPESNVENLAKKGWRLVYVQSRGWRRVVPSPKPRGIVELEQIKASVENSEITVAVGGGGIPVVDRGRGLEGVDAVVDKDLASSLLAVLLDADLFVILTDVEGVYREYGFPNQVLIRELCCKEAKRLLEAGYFPQGSMGPKVEAAVFFAEKTGRRALIGSLDRLEEVIKGESGTVVRRCVY
ncbi:carbamate kinase [Infirmifilum lucidum]|uniref:Carbamate kinase n=1 Tax=Infirmifilum lucidum TaxID=2776706 RepID=A0A7L9FGJ5_9CREN|nr:carbamate kinase [Infirmifilum lucidum]QOJ78432.1 carbamate kinase [Infirmifilum lucidum]